MRGSLMEGMFSVSAAVLITALVGPAYGSESADIRLTQGASGATASADSCAAPNEFKPQLAMDDVTVAREASTTGRSSSPQRSSGGAGSSGGPTGSSSNGSGVK